MKINKIYKISSHVFFLTLCVRLSLSLSYIYIYIYIYYKVIWTCCENQRVELHMYDSSLPMLCDIISSWQRQTTNDFIDEDAA